MGFDLSSAKPVAAFDLSTAKPVDSADAPDKPSRQSYGLRVSQAGDAFDKAAGPGFWNSIGNTAAAAMDVGTHMATGLAGDLLGAGTSLVTQNPQRGAAVRSAVSDWGAPTTEAGKAADQYVGALGSPLANLLNRPVSALEDSGHPILAQGARAAEDVVPFAGPKLLGGASRLIPRIAAAMTPEVAEASNAGLKLTPQQGGGALGQAAQSLTGSAKLERSLSIKNAPQVNKLGAQEIGAPDLSDTSIANAKKPANAVYAQAKQAGPVALQPQDFQNVKVPGTLQDPAVQALQNHYSNMGQISAADLVADMRKLRADAPKNIKAPNSPSQNDLGWAQKAAADGLESALDRQLQALGPNAPVSITDFRNARVQLAKIHSVEDAMDGPNLSPKELAKQLGRNAPLSGNLKTIANAYNNFDRSLQDVSRIRDAGPFGALDTSVLALSGFKHPLGAAAVLAKPIIRSALSSDFYQKFGIRNAPVLSPAISGLLNTGGKVSPASALSLWGPQQPGLLQ